MLCPAPAPSGSGFRPLSLTRLLVLSGCAHTPAPHPHTEKGRREWATLLRGQPLRSTGTEKSSAASPAPGPDGAACTMKDEVALLATVTLLGVLLQAYFSLRVISARRAFRVAPPLTTGPPEFERVYRAQCGGPVRSGLPVRAPPLLSGLLAVGAAKVREPGGAPGETKRRPRKGCSWACGRGLSRRCLGTR
ncbi:leukotriene C4 synthase isoform X3 [Manis javanica]|uniref:leukotriene C4 synthase isoform X3 n=1 Tax=Manis javanica TaxID=9974 RepID=UPI003C6D9F5A